MVIAVVGASGFVGFELVKKLVDSENQIRVLSRNESYPIKGVTVFSLDLTHEDADFGDFLGGVDILYNCSGVISDESLMWDLHVTAMERLTQFSRGRVKRWVQLGSVGSYGCFRDGDITEDFDDNPVGLYEKTKTISDNIIKNSGIPYVILRPSNIFGLSMSNQSVFELLKAIRLGVFFYIGRKDSVVNYIHIDDVVSALIKCGVHRLALGNTFNVSQSIKTSSMVRSLQMGSGVKGNFLRFPEALVRRISQIVRMLYKPFPLTGSRIDALTGHCVYNSQKIVDILSFEFGKDLEDRFYDFSLDVSQSYEKK